MSFTRKVSSARKIYYPVALSLAISSCLLCAPGQAQSAQPTVSLNIPAQDLAKSIDEFSKQTGLQILYKPEVIKGQRASKVGGISDPESALSRLLMGTNVVWERVNANTIVLKKSKRVEKDTRPASSEGKGTGGQSQTVVTNLPEILVIGSRSQNVDIQRTEDDALPYVIIGREEIERSGADNIEELLRRKLPMNTQSVTNSQSPIEQRGNLSEVNLRGLGANQTLILIDGRRPARANPFGSDFTQADINGIPLSSIERIEVLPSTAGGIYGGNAVGGVINIIRKHDYTGVEARVTYGAAVRGGAETARYDLLAGFSSEDGRTQASVSASESSSNPLYASDNSLTDRGRSLFLANNPDLVLFPSYLTNIQSLAFQLDPGCGCYVRNNLVLDNGTSLNSDRTFVPEGYPGAVFDGGLALIPNAGLRNGAMPDDANGRRADLLSNTRVRSINVNLRRSFTEDVDGFADLDFSENRSKKQFGHTIMPLFGIIAADAPNNPFQQDIAVYLPQTGLEFPSTNTSEALGGNVGLIFRLSPKWSGTAEYGWSRARVTGAYQDNPLTQAGLMALVDGTLNPVRDTNKHPLDFSPYRAAEADANYGPFDTLQKNISARVSGTLASLPGGDLNLTSMLEHRRETAPANLFRASPYVSFFSTEPGYYRYYPERSQEIRSAYVEVRTPLIAPKMEVPFVRSLELQLSGRNDKYRTVSASPTSAIVSDPSDTLPQFADVINKVESTDVTMALRWQPSQGVALRASYSTGFLPPSISQLTPTVTGPLSFPYLIDPLRGNSFVGVDAPFTLVTGGNPNLEPEKSRSRSFGLVWTPASIEGLRLSVDFTNIRKTGEINFLAFSQLPDETVLPDRVGRGPNLPSDPAGWPGPVTFIDLSLINIAASSISAYDLQADYSFESERFGRFRLFALGTITDELKRRLTATSEQFESVGYFDGPLRLRTNAGLEWSVGGLDLGWTMQFYDGYSVRFAQGASNASNDDRVVVQGSETIPSQVYHDLSGRYSFAADHGILAGVVISAGIQNVLDKKPPVIASLSTGYSSYGDANAFAVTASTNITAASSGFNYGYSLGAYGNAPTPVTSDGKIIVRFDSQATTQLVLKISGFTSDPGKAYFTNAFATCLSAPVSFSSASAGYTYVAGSATWVWARPSACMAAPTTSYSMFIN